MNSKPIDILIRDAISTRQIMEDQKGQKVFGHNPSWVKNIEIVYLRKTIEDLIGDLREKPSEYLDEVELARQYAREEIADTLDTILKGVV